MKSGNDLSSQRLSASTFGVRKLNFCVRYGNRRILSAIITAMAIFLSVSLPKNIYYCFRRFLPLYCGFPSPSSSFPKTYNYIAPFKSSYFSIFSFLARKNYRVFVKRFVFVFFSKLFSLFFRDQALDLLVSVSYTHYCASTSDLSTLSSSRGLTTFQYGISYLEASFTLRCFQRLSQPHSATLLCRWRDNRCTVGAFIPVLSY